MKSVLVTGGTGFVGRAVLPALLKSGWGVVASVRREADFSRVPKGARAVAVGDLSPATDWSAALDGVSAVVHLAARAHRLEDGAAQAGEYRRVNAEATAALAAAAARAGAKRFVFLSSVKAAGESTEPGRPWDERSPCAPPDAYGESKLEAERALAATSGLSSCSLRAPLVYGPGVKANFLRLLSAVQRGVPLPFGSVDNRRSLLYSGNLADAVALALETPAAEGAFFIRDGEDLSTAELVRRMGRALGRPARLLSVPPALLRAGAGLLGRGGDAERLLGDLAVDDARLRAALSWRPPFTVDEGLAATAEWYIKERLTQ
ncbi:MAG: NAD-dependent epimerase/dehydratase family protein [Elusimicrobia bacterium]|nr:NAD-dependent epimerase/dehydratase family protein [Elusimicrobiota bacterium]